jgi:hypothetical protein
MAWTFVSFSTKLRILASRPPGQSGQIDARRPLLDILTTRCLLHREQGARSNPGIPTPHRARRFQWRLPRVGRIRLDRCDKAGVL